MLMTSVDETLHTTKYRYNAAGLPTIIEGPTGIQTTAAYNALGHKTTMSDPNQGTMTFVYNALGELTRQTDAVGTTTSFSYDQLGRTTQRTPDNGEASSYWTFDTLKKGALTTEKLGTGSLFSKTYSYDDLVRPTSVTTTLDGSKHFTQSTTYDSQFGRPTSSRQPDGTVVNYQYNARGYLASETDGTGATLRTIKAMDHNGLITQVDYRNNLSTKTTRKTSGAITAICTTLTDAECTAHTAGGVQYIKYHGYDSFGNLGQRDNYTQDVQEIFTYDVQDRLTRTEIQWITNSNNKTTTHYGYDAAGNMTKKSDFSLNSDSNGYTYGTNPRISTDNAGPNAVSQIALNDTALGLTQANRTMHFKYDLNGNMTEKNLKLNGSDTSTNELTYRTMAYNSNNKPTSITNYNGTTTAFHYGSDGLRYKQVTGTTTTYYVGGGSYEVEIDTANSNATKTRAYIGDYAIMNRGASEAKDLGLNYIHRDRLGSVDTISDGDIFNRIIATAAIEQRTYNVFGKARTDTNGITWDNTLAAWTEGDGQTNSGITPRGFTNHEHLGDSGIIHMNGRAYDPELGRFMSVDPIITMPDNGQSLNPYSYVMNNPLKYTDPSGYTFGSTAEECGESSLCESATYSGGTTMLSASDIGNMMGEIASNHLEGKLDQRLAQTLDKFYLAIMSNGANHGSLKGNKENPNTGSLSTNVGGSSEVASFGGWLVNHANDQLSQDESWRGDVWNFFAEDGINAFNQLSGGDYSGAMFSMGMALFKPAKVFDKFEVGSYLNLKGKVPGLDAHHVGQKAVMRKFIPDYDPKTAPAILVPKTGHTIRGPNGIVSRSSKGIESARQLVARDIKELRRVYPDVSNKQLQKLIQMNKDMYPQIGKK
jgi:RHS repeat-associated protein